MSEYVKEYQHSGKFGSTPILIPLAFIPAALILGLIYGHLAVYNPFIYLSFLATLGYGCSLSVVVSSLGLAGKCRNLKFMTFAKIGASIAGVYAGWVGFLYAYYSQDQALSYLDVLLSPGDVWFNLQALNATGWWGIGSSSEMISGIPLTICWVIEAGIIIFLGTVSPFNSIEDRVFCEVTNKWCLFKNGFLKLELPKGTGEMSRLKEGDLGVVAELHRADSHQARYLKVNVHLGKAPSTLAAFQLFSVLRTKDEEGKPEEKEEELSPLFVVPPEAVELFETWSKTKRLRPKHQPKEPEQTEEEGESEEEAKKENSDTHPESPEAE